MGTVYKFTDDGKIIINFEKDHAIKLLGKELIRAQRIHLNERTFAPARIRIDVEDFNEYFREKYPSLYAPLLFGPLKQANDDLYTESREKEPMNEVNQEQIDSLDMMENENMDRKEDSDHEESDFEDPPSV